jgi:hypothetical protein
MKNSQMKEKNTLYQTKGPSLREISLPNIPVNPASITAMCNTKYDFFIKNYPPRQIGRVFLINNQLKFEE